MFHLFNTSKAPKLSMSDAIEQVAAGTLILIDVRDANELAQTGKAEGAIHLPLISLQMKADPSSPEVMPRLHIDTPIGIYCATGARSGMAARALRKMGYKTVHNLGGLGKWAQAGGKIIHA
ncbi:sulfurtransferase [Marinosulfonomonas sp. PRT-SC04]|nr:sulfurtransferase [Marinosulfonomonas sp. PRT-SC04]